MKAIPVIRFEPDGYVLDGPKLMGRQSAGNSFLRAVVTAISQDREHSKIFALTPFKSSAAAFNDVVTSFSSSVKTGWVRSSRLDLLSDHGMLFLPGPDLAKFAQQRLRVGPAAWSLTGVTYTLCSHQAMDAIVDMVSAPVMPWDALICATSVAQHAVKTLFQLQAEYLTWRFGVKNFVLPQLPIIPFGVHQADFSFTNSQKQAARQALKLADGDIAVLFAGRLSFHAKAHPFPMIVALEEAAKQTKRQVVLVLCGQFPNEAVHDAFLKAVAVYAPHVRAVWVNGKDFEAYNRAWAASDIFVSLSDNLQETFGITPVEAMASGLPVVVTDWDGYKDTVVEGVTGFRIPTWMPPPDIGMSLAAAFEAGTINYDRYIGLACLEVCADNRVLVDRLISLISDPEMRRRMGAAGRERVANIYDWSVVIQKYMATWQELEVIRQKAASEFSEALGRAPKCMPSRQDPYRIFSSFPTQMIGVETQVSLAQSLWPLPNWKTLQADPLFSYAADFLADQSTVERVCGLLAAKSLSITQLSGELNCTKAEVIRIVAPLAKVGMVKLENPESSLLKTS